MSSRGVNKVILIGNLGNEPELMTFEGGTSLCHFTLATSEQWLNAKTNQTESKTEWHRIVAFGQLATICKKYLDKGDKVYVEGKLQTREWLDNNNVKRQTTEIVIHNMQMLTPPKQQEQQQPGNQQNRAQQAMHPDLT